MLRIILLYLCWVPSITPFPQILFNSDGYFFLLLVFFKWFVIHKLFVPWYLFARHVNVTSDSCHNQFFHILFQNLQHKWFILYNTNVMITIVIIVPWEYIIENYNLSKSTFFIFNVIFEMKFIAQISKNNLNWNCLKCWVKYNTRGINFWAITIDSTYRNRFLHLWRIIIRVSSLSHKYGPLCLRCFFMGPLRLLHLVHLIQKFIHFLDFHEMHWFETFSHK